MNIDFRFLAITSLLGCIFTSAIAVEAPHTLGQSCQAIGNRYAKCALASAVELPCPAGWDLATPERCQEDKEYRRGVMEGLLDFQRVTEKKATAMRTLAAAADKPGARPVAAQKPPTKTVHRRLTGEECARMERELPAVADALGMRRKDYTQLKNEAKSNTFPEAALAMLGSLIVYNNESLIRYPYEMAKSFGEKCRQGKIRVDD